MHAGIDNFQTSLGVVADNAAASKQLLFRATAEAKEAEIDAIERCLVGRLRC